MDKTQYFSILKQLHDICRDTPAPTFTGMDAYNEIMNYLYLRHLSDNKDDIPDEHNLKYIYENYCTDKKIKDDLQNIDLNKSSSKSGIKKKIYFEELSEKLLPGLINQERNKNISFIKIMGDDINNFKLDIGRITNLIHKDEGASNTDGGQKAQKLINKIYEKDFLPLNSENKFDIKLFPYDALGEGFEKFMSDAGSSGGNWGQYFTNPQVINYLIEKVNIKKNDKLIDPFAGSGGFLLQAKYKSKIKSDNIYAHETDDKIYKFLKFNSNIADIKLDNIEKGDTFDYQDYLKDNENKYDKILSNPPFGCSIEILLSGSKDKSAYWDIMKSGKYTIKDSMGLAVYAMYKMLKEGGIAGFVSERGILNNGTENKSWQKNLRKFILENTEIKEIMLLPKGIFSHTNFDTACIIFEKGKTTKQVIYHQGYFKDEDKGKGDKKMYVKENVLTITLEQIVNKDWSLKYDDYIEKKDESYEGITYKTLDQICEFVRGKVLTSSDVEKNKGEYPVIGGGVKPFGYYKEYNMPEKSILISQSGANAGYVSRYDNKVWASDCFSVNYTNNNFMYYYLKLQQNKIMKRQSEGGLQTGQAQPHVNCNDMKKLKIPILPQDHQERIVEYMDKIFGSDYKKLDKLVSKFKDYDLFKILLNENYSGFDKLLELYDDIIYQEGFYKRYTTEYKNMLIQRCFKMVPSKEVKLGDVCNYDIGGTPATKETKYWNGNNLWVSISDLNNDIITNTERKITDLGIEKSSVKLIKKGTILFSFKLTIGKMGIAGSDLYCNEAIAFFTNLKINKDYLYNILKYTNIDHQKHLFNSQIGKALNKSTLGKILIQVPIKEEDQLKVIDMINDINKEESEFNKQVESMKIVIQKLYDCVDLTVNYNNPVMDNDNSVEKLEDNSDDDSDEEQSESEEYKTIEYKTIEYKGNNYILEGDEIYNINDDDTKGKLFGSYIDEKVKKIKTSKLLVV